MTISKQALRRLMIKKQMINNTLSVDKKDVYEVVEKLGCIQIDTINVVERAHYLTLWTRLGIYDKKDLWDLAYEDKELFEYDAHATCYIPFKDYRFYLLAMKLRREEIYNRFKKWSKTDTELLDTVLDRIRREGPLSSKDFEGPKRIGGWWNWKPAKVALELLFGAGILLIDHRDNFQKYYDMADKIIPGWVDTNPPDDAERVQFFIEKTLKCLGLVKPQEVRNYFQEYSVKLGKTTKEIRDILDSLVSEGEIYCLEVDWDKDPYYCLPEDYDQLDDLSYDFGSDDVKLVGYFDNFMWNRDRIRLLFNFDSKLEIYIPKKDRVYGYYHFPILYGDKLVARIEPKMDRSNNRLLILGYWLEEGFESNENYEDKLWKNLESFAIFNGAEEIDWEHKLTKIQE